MKDDRKLFTRIIRTTKALFWLVMIALAAWAFVEFNQWLLRSELEPEPKLTQIADGAIFVTTGRQQQGEGKWVKVGFEDLEDEPASTEKYEWPRPNDPDTFTAQTAGWYTTISTGWRLISTNRECPNLEPVKKGTP